MLKSRVELSVIGQVFREAADGVQIVAIQNDGVLVGVDGVLVILALFVGCTESGVQLADRAVSGIEARTFSA